MRELNGSYDVSRHPFGTYEKIERILCQMCSASGWSIWPHEMQQRKLWEIRVFFEHKHRRTRELTKANKGSMSPQYPDWIL